MGIIFQMNVNLYFVNMQISMPKQKSNKKYKHKEENRIYTNFNKYIQQAVTHGHLVNIILFIMTAHETTLMGSCKFISSSSYNKEPR